ncbi:2'-5' RNA ligase family protein [Actinoplanes sp. CA-030573]|uniref:2'-5' RNA ligase family protein n=1 Tax=Actinoplanes sp. CA-030573 TaxID=3239898 RepID=UPI003D8CBD3B
MDATRSALIVPIPEAEPAVAKHRDRLDLAAAWGVPAHVTVLYPFLPAAELDEHVLATLKRIVAGVPAFFLTLDGIDWFGDRTVWLSPNPAEPFRRLTAEVVAHFPGYLPYGGAFDEVVPHLTIGEGHPVEELTAAGEAILPYLPIHARVDAVRLITGREEPGGSWLTRAVFPLG